MWLIRFLFFVIAIIILVGFVVYNPGQTVNLHFPWGDYYNVQLTIICLFAFAAGMLISFIYAIFYYLKIAGDIREKNRQIKQLEVELSALRNRSLEDLEEAAREQEGR